MPDTMRPFEKLRRFLSSLDRKRERDAVEVFLNANDSDGDNDAFEAYFEFIEDDPQNADDMRALNEIWDRVGDLSDPPYPNVKDLTTDGRASPFEGPKIAAIAAGVAAVAIAAAYLLFAEPTEHAAQIAAYSTERGERRPIVLEDGTTVTLGGASQIQVAINDAERTVTLLSGDSFLDVVSDRNRRFVVNAGEISVHAVGTAFSVNRLADDVTVAVSEGIVDVSKGGADQPLARLSAGEQIRVRAAGDNSAVTAIDTDNIAAWRRGQLILNDEALPHAVATINRYYDGVITAEDPRLATLRASGVVDMYNPAEWLNGLQTVLPIEVRQIDANAYLLTYKGET